MKVRDIYNKIAKHIPNNVVVTFDLENSDITPFAAIIDNNELIVALITELTEDLDEYYIDSIAKIVNRELTDEQKVMFLILHEVGHVVHYQQSNMTVDDYIAHAEELFEAVTNDEEYRLHEYEAYADRYAIDVLNRLIREEMV